MGVCENHPCIGKTNGWAASPGIEVKAPRSVRTAENFGRVRLSPSFYMRDFVHSESILLVDAYAPQDPTHAAEYNRIERLRYPSHARASSLPELASLFSRCGLGQPWIIRYELLVELKDLLARAFPNRGDKAEIAAVFTAAAGPGKPSGCCRQVRNQNENGCRQGWQSGRLSGLASMAAALNGHPERRRPGTFQSRAAEPAQRPRHAPAERW